jgi:hypothetical protein
LSCGESFGIVPGQLLKLRREIHLFRRIKIVIASSRPVCAEPDRDSALQYIHHRCDAARQHHVTRWIVRNSDVVLFENGDVAIAYPDTMRGDGAAVEEAERIQIFCRAHVVLGLHFIVLFFCF